MAKPIPHTYIRKTTYWFRLRVPKDLTGIVGSSEIYRSLQTSCPKEAKRRSASLWLACDRIFNQMTKKDIKVEVDLLKSQLDKAMQGISLIRENQKKISAIWETAHTIQKLKLEILEHNNTLAEVDRDLAITERDISMLEKEQVERKYQASKEFASALLADGHKAEDENKKSPLLSSVIEDFINTYKRGVDGKAITNQTVAQAQVSLRLFLELIGDNHAHAYVKKDAARFKELLGKVPSSHGKDRKGLSAMEAIAANEARPVPLPGISAKTTKRHFSALAGLWNYLEEREFVNENIFYGHKHRGAKSSRSQRMDWSDEDLLTLFGKSRWHSGQPNRSSAYFWMPILAMFSGMRMEEIARLRRQDIRVIDDVLCFDIREHDGWSPKTEAGERIIPVHSSLKTLGFIDFVEGRAEGSLWLDLKAGGPDGKFSCEFSRLFSKEKIALGVSKKTTFHSFRHSVRTILDNQDASIRESWIDAVMGHEAGAQASTGRRVYTKRTDTKWLVKTVESISYSQVVMDELFRISGQSAIER